MLRILIFIAFAIQLTALPATGQANSKLADQYYLDGEYEKAAELYQRLYTQSNRSDYYFNKYIECLLALEQYEESEKIIREQITLSSSRVSLYVTLGNVLERQNKFAEADDIFASAIDNLPADVGEITKLGNSFLMLTKYDMAIETYEKGQQLVERPGLFSHHLADLYRRKGDSENMVVNYLYSLHANPKRLPGIQTTLKRYLPADDIGVLQEQLYAMIQEYPDADHFPEMLGWVFIQRKDFVNALRQSKALDMRLDENGYRVYRLARMAANAKQYDVAIDGFEYIVQAKGPSSSFYIEAKRRSLIEQRNKLISNYDYSTEDLKELETKYHSFLDDIGRNQSTAPIIAELARLHAFYFNDLDAAIQLLQEVVNYPGVNKNVQAQAKLDLADFYLMSGEIWEATLLYSQVDKSFKEELLGQEARFRNAKLSYYNSEFEWAGAQFDILKASTSKLIANDALDMSIFIMDNLGLDTTAHPLAMYAEAELMVFQNKFDEAFAQLNILANIYSDHGLQDDVLYLKAQIYIEQREYDLAIEMFEQIIEEFPDDIRADNAMFELAELYQKVLAEPAKAQDLYERLFMDYSSSTFSIEARKRFRQLRGDFDS